VTTNPSRMVLHQAIRWFLRRLDTHPLSVTAGTVGVFTTAGLISWQVMELLEASPDDADAKKKNKMSLEEAKLRAMIENAQTASSWQENLDNAASAQQQFMLPGRPHPTPNFMMEIDKRSLEILKEQHEKLDREKKRKPTTTRIWY
jgi:hypothetical protein